MNFDANEYKEYLSNLTLPALRAEQKIIKITALSEKRILHHIKQNVHLASEGVDVFVERNLNEYKEQSQQTILKLEAFSEHLERRNDKVLNQLNQKEEPLHTQIRLLRTLTDELNNDQTEGEES